MVDINKVSNVKIEQIDINDWPKFTMAIITSGQYNNRPLTEEELNFIQETFPDFIRQEAYETLVNNYNR